MPLYKSRIIHSQFLLNNIKSDMAFKRAALYLVFCKSKVCLTLFTRFKHLLSIREIFKHTKLVLLNSTYYFVKFVKTKNFFLI